MGTGTAIGGYTKTAIAIHYLVPYSHPIPYLEGKGDMVRLITPITPHSNLSNLNY